MLKTTKETHGKSGAAAEIRGSGGITNTYLAQKLLDVGALYQTFWPFWSLKT